MSISSWLRAGLTAAAVVALGCASTLPDKAPIETGPIQIGKGEQRITDQVIVITDASGTMYLRKTFPDAKALARSFVASMPEAGAPSKSGRVYDAGAVGFGGKERSGAPLATFDRSRLATATANLQIMGDISGTGGTTPLDAVIREAAWSLQGKRGRAALVIFSDGLPDHPDAALYAARKLAAGYPDPVCIYAVQTGTDVQGYEFLKRLSQTTPCGSLNSDDDITTRYELQQFARAVFLGTTPPPSVAAGPCTGTLRLHGINFAFDKADIAPESRPVLDVAVQHLGQCADIKVTITGYTDSVGSEQYNASLSERRAKATMKYLVSKGVDPARLTAEGRGEWNPIAPNDTAAGRAENRRVEMVPAE
jgi:outer membrane protein OmpA-like peptidoglycan-associated protein